MIDLHSHILPGIDDGPELMDGSVALARAAYDCGIHLITATPHLRADHPGVHLDQIADRCAVLEEALAREGVDVRVLPAGEVDLLWASEATPEELRLATYAQRGTDMLLETPYGPVPPNFGDLVTRFGDQGIRVLLAHPERNPTFQRDPHLVVELVERGVLVQVTALSLAGGSRSSRSRRVARWLVEQGAAHVIASDSHSAGPWRSPDVRAAVAIAESIDPARAEWMVHEVPQAIVAGEPLPLAPAGSAASGALGRVRQATKRRAPSPS